MKFDYSTFGIRKSIFEQIDPLKSVLERRETLIELIEEYAYRVVAILDLNPDSLEDLHSSVFWKVFRVGCDVLAEEAESLFDNEHREEVQLLLADLARTDRETWSIADSQFLHAIPHRIANLSKNK